MEYKRVPFETAETEVDQKCHRDFEQGKYAPSESEEEARWIAQKKKLYTALSILTPRQREVYILRVGYEMTETRIAARLHINQSVVARHLKAADKKLQKMIGNITDR